MTWIAKVCLNWVILGLLKELEMLSLRSLLYFNIYEKLDISCSGAEDLDLGSKKKKKAFKGSRKSLKLFDKNL